MKKIIALLLTAILALSCFAACAPSEQTPTTAAGDTEAAAQATTEAETKTVVVGYTIYEPMNYKDDSGKLVGFDTELAEAVFGNLGYEVIFQ